MVLLEENHSTAFQNVTDLLNSTADPMADLSGKKMTYNEWRQLRKRRRMLYKAPVCQTRLQSLEVQAGYSVKLSVVVTGFPVPDVMWTLDDEEIEEGHKFMFEIDEAENKYSLVITQISPAQSGCYQCVARNCEGSDSTMGFINVKDSSRQKRKRSVSRRPLVSTIMEWKSREEPEADPAKERLLLRNRHCWDWWNLGAASDDENQIRGKREQSCDLDLGGNNEAKTEEEWEESRRHSQMTSTRSRSLPNMSENGASGCVVENKYKKLKTFWEQQKNRR